MDVNQIIIALETAANNKQQFLKFVQLCGYSSKHREYKRLDYMVVSSEDLADWFDVFDGDIDNIAEATQIFKENRRKRLDLSQADFLILCENDLKIGLEQLFMEECSPHSLIRLQDKLYKKEISLKYIYSKSKSDIWYNNPSKFANANWYDRGENDE